MPNRMYEKGCRHERELVNLGKDRGDLLSIRTAGSHSKFDVIRISGDVLELIQVKGTRQKIEYPNIPPNLKVVMKLMWKEKGKWREELLGGELGHHSAPNK